MTRSELMAMKNRALERKEKATDLDIIVSEVMRLPPGQLKRVLTEAVLDVLKKYGYVGD